MPARVEDVASQVNALLAQTGLLSAPRVVATLDDMVLAPQVRRQLSRVVLEHARHAALLARGLRPARKLLFSGLPGTGKTMAAGAIARAIGMPMFRVETHTVFSHYFAESAQRLAKVFEYVRMMPGVYLFDEFDALGAERSSMGQGDNGESRRVVNALLQFIEGDQSSSVIVAATNHAQMLDSALFRRFDETIVFEPLTKDELVDLVNRKLAGFTVDPLDFDAIYDAVQPLGHADLCAALDRARKDNVLEGGSISTGHVVEEITRRMALATVRD